MDARLSWPSWLVTYRDTRPKTVTHPSTNRARLRVTSFMRRTALTITPGRQPYWDYWTLVFYANPFLPHVSRVLILALSVNLFVFLFVCPSNISGTAERICARFGENSQESYVFGPCLGRVWMSRSKVKVNRDKDGMLRHPHWQCIVKPWLHVQLLHAIVACNYCMQQIACNYIAPVERPAQKTIACNNCMQLF